MLWKSIALGLVLALPCGALTAEQKAMAARGSREAKAGWICLHLEGGPRELGFQHGFLLAPEIQGGLRATRIAWEHRSGTPWASLVAKASAFFVPGVDAESLRELEGMAEGLAAAGVTATRDELVVYNGYSELSDYWWPQELNRRKNETAPHHVKESCSAFIAVGSCTRGGQVVMGHNTMTGYQDPQVNVVVDLVPDRGHRILMQGVPGWIHSGTDFFITDAGLVGCETTIGDFQPYDAGGVPEFARMRRATQDAGDIDAWCRIMKTGNNGGYANAWLLGDIRRGEIARLELGLRYVAFERKKDGDFCGSNIAEDPRILCFETTTRETDTTQSKVARRVRWKELLDASWGRIDAEMAQAFEADHRDTTRRAERPGGRSLCGHFDLEPEPLWDGPFEPAGTTDAKVVDSDMARRMVFLGRFGAACGRAFDAEAFLAERPQFGWMKDIMPSRPSQPWVILGAGVQAGTGRPPVCPGEGLPLRQK